MKPAKKQPTKITTRIPDVLVDFLSGKSENTLRAYSRDLETFREFMGVESKKTAVDVFLSDGPGKANSLALKYKDYLINHPDNLSPNTINRKLYALKALVKTARIVGAVHWNLEFKRLKTESIRDTRGPGLDVFRTMLDLVRYSDKPRDIRDYAMLRMFFDMGLRRSSVINLDIQDIDFYKGTIWIFLKGRMQKKLKELPDITLQALKRWVDIRGVGEGPVFVNMDRNKNNTGKRITGNGVYKIIQRLSEKAGKKTRPHGLRHLAITEAIKETARRGMSLAEVVKFSDHANVQTLMIYNDGIDGVQKKISSMVASLV